jgi:2-polyprenyl-6-methoxyphenol hydroxylase-like FAD-dependent oxidoreductase
MNAAATSEAARVVVVGAGPVGLMLAGELALGGAEVVVLEKLDEPTTESRASTVHARTMEILDQRGLIGRLSPDGRDLPPQELKGHFGGLPLDFGAQPTRYPGQWKVLQARIEKVLAEWARGLGAEIRRGHEVRVLTVHEDRVELEVRHGGGLLRIAADYVAGCDGEESSVRRLAGFDFPGADATRELIRADVVGVEVPDRRFERTPFGLAIAATRNGVTRVMVHEFGREARLRDTEPDFAEMAEVWGRVTGEDIGGGTPTWVNAFGNVNRQAARYRDGRVLLAGDAAHRQMPVGGQALNLGLQDAANLGWRLAAVAASRAPDRLLDAYDAERRAVGRRVLGNIAAQTLFLLGGPEVESMRAVMRELLEYPVVRERLASMISGLDIRYSDGGAEADEPEGVHPLVGARLPHLGLATDAGPLTSTELLRTGRGLLLDLSRDPSRRDRLESAAAPWAGRVDVIGVTAVTAAPEEAPGADTLLVRPDGYVAWTGDLDADPRAALDRCLGTVFVAAK